MLVAWRKRGKGKAGTVGAAAVWLGGGESETVADEGRMRQRELPVLTV